MAQNLTLLSIAELFERSFFIPSYQRGYRWGAQQVIDLLTDLYTFSQKKGKASEEFYCLQPIVVKKHEWKEINNKEEVAINGWEVVDGQQRLTTIRILLQYLVSIHLRGASLKNEYGREVYSIHYETRKDSEIFLSNIREDATDDVDFYYMAQAHLVIRQWFEGQVAPRDTRESILRTLVNVKAKQQAEGIAQVIWYELSENENPIDNFVRINLGKIPLTNAELIKALFLQKANFGSDQNELARLRQIEIANEWDHIENTLQQPLFWAFLNKDRSNRASRIEILLDLLRTIAVRVDPALSKVIGTDEHATFRYFYHLLGTQPSFETMKNAWESIQECFRTIQEWFSIPEWYHYIGFLIVSNKETLSAIYLSVKKGNLTSKGAVTQMLEDKIRSMFTDVGWIYNNITNNFILNLTYSGERVKVRQLLLLFNIECVVLQCKANQIITKFPFDTFKGINEKEGWDVEHIDPATDNDLRSREVRLEWLQNTIADFEKLSADEVLLQRMQKYIQNEKSAQNFDELYTSIIDIAGDKSNDDAIKDNIGNLALLDAGTNRAYGNALFTTKRRIILEKDKTGRFIPLCTRNVFLKYYDTLGNNPSSWTKADMDNYRINIETTLSRFLVIKPTISNSNA